MTKLSGTVVFVHGTGSREPGYSASFKQVTDGLRQALPGADLTITRCYWGEPLGAKLPEPSGSIPRELPQSFEPGADGDDINIALWGMLYQDPLYELRVLAAGASPPASMPDLSGPLAGRVQSAASVPALRELAREAGIDGVLDEACQFVITAPPYQETLSAPTQSLETYTMAVARAIVAQAIALCEQRQLPAQVIFDAGQRDALVALLVSELSGGAASFSIVGWLTRPLQELAESAATWYVQRNRDSLTDAAYPFAGDVVLYQGHGAPIREFILRTIEQAQPPVVVVAHSLGGIICVDTLALTQVPQVKLLVTVGSQAPFLYEINALQSLRFGVPLPAHFPRWLNIYDRRDFLSYVGGDVFPGRVRDVMVDNRQPFARSHSAYWANPATWETVAREIGEAL